MTENVSNHPAIIALEGNREAWGTRATPPDREHYPHTFLWDGAFVAIVRAQYGDVDQAAVEIQEILSGQKKDGLVPNMKFGPGRSWDPERRLNFLDRHTSSDYSQPPLLADAALRVHDAYKAAGRERDGKKFLMGSYEQLQSYYKYWDDFRTDPESSLIAVIHPHETGRDSDPTFDFSKRRIKQPPQGTFIARGVVDKANTALDYIGSLHLGRRLKKVEWDPERAKDIFWVKDVMMNAIYAQNLSFMSYIAQALGREEESQDFLTKSQEVEQDMLEHMWDSNTGIFHAINKNGDKIPEVSVGNLFPILLPSISSEQVESVLTMLEDPQWFNTSYPIPSVPVRSKKYDPTFSEHRLWRGPTWMNTNWYIIEGLLMQRDRFIDVEGGVPMARRLNAAALRIALPSAELIEIRGPREFYNPETGEGIRVRNFAWSNLGHILKDKIPEMKEFEENTKIRRVI